MKKLLIATSNPGKLTEIKFFLKDLPLKLVSLSDLGIKEKVDENGKTFEENAAKKAKFYCQISGLPTIADDGGLEIDYLHGEPGIKSRRWIDGKEASDKELINYTLEKLKGLPKVKRGAQLRVYLALALPASPAGGPDGKVYSRKRKNNAIVYISEGKIRGIISEKIFHILTPGFPFRSLLYIPAIGKYYHHKNLTEAENLKYNHRGIALKVIKRILKQKVLK